jgi:hypothetical protein
MDEWGWMDGCMGVCMLADLPAGEATSEVIHILYILLSSGKGTGVSLG